MLIEGLTVDVKVSFFSVVVPVDALKNSCIYFLKEVGSMFEDEVTVKTVLDGLIVGITIVAFIVEVSADVIVVRLLEIVVCTSAKRQIKTHNKNTE